MKPVKPKVVIEGDNADKIMARLGWIIGYDRRHVIWVFGILPGTPASKAWGVSIPKLTFVIAQHRGKVIRTETAAGVGDLSEWFQEILEA